MTLFHLSIWLSPGIVLRNCWSLIHSNTWTVYFGGLILPPRIFEDIESIKRNRLSLPSSGFLHKFFFTQFFVPKQKMYELEFLSPNEASDCVHTITTTTEFRQCRRIIPPIYFIFHLIKRFKLFTYSHSFLYTDKTYCFYE